MNHVTRLVALAAFALLPAVALAHPGHGVDGIWHSLSAGHIAPIALVLIASGLIARRLWLRSQR